MKNKTACIIGVGLIGGSLAIQLREKGIASVIIGVDSNAAHLQTALERSLIDKAAPIEEAIRLSSLIILSTPVDVMLVLLPDILSLIDDQVVMDTGSTKASLLKMVQAHPKRGRYVATHPMWGGELHGPQAAMNGAFNNRIVAICGAEDSEADALSEVEGLYRKMGMRIVNMNSVLHDKHTAYVSHVSHIISFAFANTVLEKEKEEEEIFILASTGFETSIRMAKGIPEVWAPIFRENKQNVLDVLNEYIIQLFKFKNSLERDDGFDLKQLISSANRINRQNFKH